MQFRESSEFTTKALKILGDEGIFKLQEFLLEKPDAGQVIQGSGGLRKLRWAAKGRGKRGGARVIYIYYQLVSQIDLLTIYAKNEKADLTKQEIKKLKDQ